jgi:hypothetical protein
MLSLFAMQANAEQTKHEVYVMQTNLSIGTKILLFILILLGYNSALAQEVSDTINTVNLSEVTVEAKLVKRTADGDQYLITDQMRNMGLNSFELLACIPGLHLNRALNQIIINN